MRALLIQDGTAIDAIRLDPDWTDTDGQWQPPPGVTVVPSDTAQIGWTWDGNQWTPNVTTTPLPELRRSKSDEIKSYALSLMQARIPALDSFAMVAFLKTLWPVLSAPGDQPDLAYVRDVYVYAIGKLDQLSTATRKQIEGYDPAQDTGWPT